MIIGLSGRAGSGKDTIADFMCDELRGAKMSFATPIKAGLKAMFGLTDAHLYGDLKEIPIRHLGYKSPRFLMQTLGTEWGRDTVSKSLWVDLAINNARNRLTERPRVNAVVFADVRFDDEAVAIRRSGGFVINVVRPDQVEVEDHSSEEGISESLMSRQIVNDGCLGDLKSEAAAMALELYAQKLRVIR